MMRKTLKILAVFLLIFLLSIYYFFYTKSGVKQGYFLLGYIISVKNDLDVKILDIDLYDYPNISAKAKVERKYTVDILGEYSKRKFDMNYSIISDCIESNICRIDDNVEIYGSLKGYSRDLKIRGKGKILGGEIIYEALRKKHGLEDIHIRLVSGKSAKVFELMGEKVHLDGELNVSIVMDILSKEERKGRLDFSVEDSDYEGMRVSVHSKVEIDNNSYTFSSLVKTLGAELKIMQGKYDRTTKLGEASYVLDIPNALDIEKLLKFKLNSPLHSVGKIVYDKKLRAEGFVENFGGLITLDYEHKKISFDVDNVALDSVLEKLSVETLFDTNISGKGAYNLLDKNLSFDAKLSDLVFRNTTMTRDLYKSLEVNLSEEIFTQNTLNIRTVEGKLYHDIHLKNSHNFIQLSNTYINAKNNSMRTEVDIGVDTYALEGLLFVKIDKYTKAKDTYINFDGKVQKHYTLTLNGMMNPKWMSMDYSIASKRFPSHICTIEDDVNLSGHISGALKRLQIEGKGLALEGQVEYKGMKNLGVFEDIHLKMDDIHALKLSTLLGVTEIPSGRADIEADFELFSSQNKKGILTYHLREAFYETLPLNIHTRIEMDNKKHDFEADIRLNHTKITLKKGKFSEDTKQSEASYILDIPHLSQLAPLFTSKNEESFYALGKVSYDNNFIIHGLSKSFGGLSEFHYEDEHLSIDLSKVSFKDLMSIFVSPPRLDALTTGVIDYNFKTKKVIADARLRNAKFLYSPMVETIYQEASINLLKETFSDSNLSLSYAKNIFDANIELHNESNHVSIRNLKINTKSKIVNALFDVNVQNMALSGKVYGTLDAPKINLNMQKLVRHEMDKQLDSFVGEDNRKMMESMPMGDMSKDMASGVGGAFMEMFF